MGLKEKSITSALDLNKKEILSIFKLARQIKKGRRVKAEGKVALLFFEPSTRTYFSFLSASQLLGLHVLGFQNPSATSVKKGESLIDTVRMFLGYGANAVVVRHPKAGAPVYLAEKLEVPIINAGDDSREHPTQALLDVFTISEKFGGVDGLKIGILGDLRYGRTPSSLAYLLSNWDVSLYFIAPEALQIDRRNDGMERKLKDLGVEYEKLGDIPRDLDVLYVTRIQRERFPDEAEYEKVKGMYRVDGKILKEMKESAIILHPLPRIDEIPPEVDADHRALYFEQARNGMYVRAALLHLILG